MATEGNVKVTSLQVQYRMHPDLSKFSNQMFYDGAIQV